MGEALGNIVSLSIALLCAFRCDLYRIEKESSSPELLSLVMSLVPGISDSIVDKTGDFMPLLKGEAKVMRKGTLLRGEDRSEPHDAVNRCYYSLRPELWIKEVVLYD